MKNTERYLVYGASGTQGGAVAKLLVQDGFEVRTVTRNEETAKVLRGQGIKAFIGDLADVELLHQAHEGVDRVFLNLPVEFNLDKLRQYTKNAIASALKANVKLFVVNTSIYVPDLITESAGLEIKREIINEVKQSCLPFIIVEPIIYMENFLIPGTLNNGVLSYPVPADKPISWISINDAAQYHYYALRHPELAGSILPAPGLEALTGSQLAETFSDTLGENISFVSLPFNSFEAGIRPFLGEDTATGLKEVYQWIYEHTDHLPLYQEVDQSIKTKLQLTTLANWIRQTMIKA
ncbi:SDR family oxidoreductase [Paenibacillus polymyxa]|uniref:SDR family oxidoreductase n=1 Tax=Paenibacillus polymyxa TaxID=1406 RepID=UPI0023F998B8|nr:NmrA family NAD(P)-binding protein [Paenibacillus polymyxa]